MKRGTLVSLTTFGLALAILACRDLTGPLEALSSANRLLNASGPVVVSPGDMHGWTFYNDQNDTPCTDTTVCRLVDGPTGQPLGSGSAFLSTPAASDGKALILQGYAGTRFDAISELRYSTFRQSADAGHNLAIALQVNADYDLTDQSVGYQGRLVYEPYQSAPGTVLDTTWQSWDAKAGKWWGTKASVPRGGVLVANPCVQATPCTWAQLLAAFPDVGIHATYGAVVLKAGSSWPGFSGNVDALSIGVNGTTTTFDFERTAPVTGPVLPPDSVPHALFDSLGTVTTSIAGIEPGPYRRDIVVVRFARGTPLAVRMAVLDSVSGRIVGGRLDADHLNGSYFVRISGGTFDALVNAVTILQRQPQVINAFWWGLFLPDIQSYRKPNDGAGWTKTDWKIDPAAPDPSRKNWALEYVRAPMAWGCDVGSGVTSVAVADLRFAVPPNIAPNVDRNASSVVENFDKGDSTLMTAGLSKLDHGTRVASIIAAVGDDGHGMTGMAWRARLILRDIRSINNAPLPPQMTEDDYPDLMRDHLVAAGTAGASVIEMSLNKRWGSIKYDRNNPAHLAEVTAQRRTVSEAIETLATSSRYPLFVISAGNDSTTIEGGGYSGAKIDHGDQVLTVGGLAENGKVWIHSNTGADVYAPAVKVAQATGTDSIRNVDEGTSFSAPLAAGVAVLLKDFDPSLSSADLINKIRDGARDEDGVKKLDAYGALKKAAERSGAPLCGSRVFMSGDKVFALRGTTPDKIISLSPEATQYTDINVFHGGKRVDIGYQYAYVWNSTSRLFEPRTPYQYPSDVPPGGSFLSTIGQDHERYWGVQTVRPAYDDSMPLATTSIIVHSDQMGWVDHGRDSIVVLELPIVRPSGGVVVAQTPGDSDHVWNGRYNTAVQVYMGSWAQARLEPVDNFAVAMAPSGDYAVVAVNFIQRTNLQTDTLKLCNTLGPAFPANKCADGRISAVTDRTVLYQVDLTGAVPPRRVAGYTGVEIEWLSISELEDEIAIQKVVRTDIEDIRFAAFDSRGSGPWYSPVSDRVYSSVSTCTGRKLEYHAFNRNATNGSSVGALTADAQNLASGCGGSAENFAGTFSPSRQPTAPGALMVAPTLPATRTTTPDRRAGDRRTMIRR
jgi:Subtilisin-like serine proteases